MSRTAAVVALAWVALLLALPPLTGALGIGRSVEVQNRPAAELDGIGVADLADTETYTKVEAWFVDRLGLRAQAAELEARLEADVLEHSTSEKVVVGRDGWLFLRTAVTNSCIDEPGRAALADELGATLDLLAASGRPTAVVLVASRASVVPQHLTDAQRGLGACATATHAGLERLLGGRPDVVATLAPLRAAVDELGDEAVVRRRDSHWTRRGALVAAAPLVELLQPGLWDPDAVRADGTVAQEPDLARLLGFDEVVAEDAWDVERPGVSTVTGGSRPGRVGFAATSTRGEALVPGRTYVLRDSFWSQLEPHVVPYLEEAALRHWEDTPDLDLVAAEIAAADRVVVQLAGRYTDDRLRRIASEDFRARLRAAGVTGG